MNTLWDKWTKHLMSCPTCPVAYRVGPASVRFLEHTCPEGTALYRVWRSAFYYSA